MNRVVSVPLFSSPFLYISFFRIVKTNKRSHFYQAKMSAINVGGISGLFSIFIFTFSFFPPPLLLLLVFFSVHLFSSVFYSVSCMHGRKHLVEITHAPLVLRKHAASKETHILLLRGITTVSSSLYYTVTRHVYLFLLLIFFLYCICSFFTSSFYWMLRPGTGRWLRNTHVTVGDTRWNKSGKRKITSWRHTIF